VIVYCYSRVSTEKYARHIVDDGNFSNIDTAPFADFLAHLQTIYDKSEDWIVVHALKKGIGIHHGLIPKYIQKEIITLFNEGYIRALLSTTTITEGVNTTAKNILVLSHMKGSKVLKNFDALNIAGRAGRFLHHYKGNVITLDSEFLKIKDSISDPIRHKNYDNTVRKGDVDIFYT
jgi:replicative superfamily II helicase